MLPTPSTIEHFLEISEPGDGYPDDLWLPPTSWSQATDGGPLGSATSPHIDILGTIIPVIVWAVGDTLTNPAIYSGRFPNIFAVNQRALQLVVMARKVDSAADENPDLKFQCQLTWANPGEAEQTLTTKAFSAVLAASTTGASAASFAEYTLDLGARLRAESKVIKTGAIFSIQLAPHEAVGSTNMILQMAGAVLRYRRHAAIEDTAKRAF